jgi:hypothetical protein
MPTLSGAEWAPGARVFTFEISVVRPRMVAVVAYRVVRVEATLLWGERAGFDIPISLEDAYATAGAAWEAGLAILRRLGDLCLSLAAWGQAERAAGRLDEACLLDLEER